MSPVIAGQPIPPNSQSQLLADECHYGVGLYGVAATGSTRIVIVQTYRSHFLRGDVFQIESHA